MAASACNSITQEAEAGKSLSKEEKKNDFHKADLSLQICLSFPVPAPGLSWPPGATSPLPLTYFAVFERELSMAGH